MVFDYVTTQTEFLVHCRIYSLTCRKQHELFCARLDKLSL